VKDKWGKLMGRRGALTAALQELEAELTVVGCRGPAKRRYQGARAGECAPGC